MILESLIIADLLALDYLINYQINNKTLNNFTLRVGYKDLKVLRKPLTIDMRITPHLFVCGLSGNGKTKMVEYAMQDKNCVLLNVFSKDFKRINAKRIIGNDNILNYLKGFLNSMRLRDEKSKPFYIVIDELLVLCMDKNITSAIMDLLAIGRHYNVFVIGISQIGTKENVKFKDLFNSRVCFRQVEESSYRAVLGYSPTDKQLRKREFYLYSDKLDRGYTYTLN